MTFLYAIYDSEGILIYAGITDNLRNRMNNHRVKGLRGILNFKVRVLKSFEDRQEAAIAETKLILAAKIKGLCRLYTGTPSRTLMGIDIETATPYECVVLDRWNDLGRAIFMKNIQCQLHRSTL